MRPLRPHVPAPFRDEERFDVVVLGGGPGGAAAARFLAGRGHRVALLPGPATGGGTAAESLPPSSRKVLAALDLLNTVESAGFVPCSGNAVAWGGSPLEVRPFPHGSSGFQVDRRRLDALLLEAAASAGVVVIPRGRARSVVLPRTDLPGRVTWEDPDGRRGALHAPWILDASGRAGVVARQGFRRGSEGPSTTALLGVWQRAGDWPLEDQGVTLVESHREGWGWSVPLPGGQRLVGLMVDPEPGRARLRGLSLDTICRREIDRTVHLRELVRGARMATLPRARAATPYDARTYAAPGVLLVGDAGSFLDPLSSYGVRKALASGWLAAVATHTALTRPGMQDHALGLFQEREARTWAAHAGAASTQYALAEQAHDHVFWSRRAVPSPQMPGDPGGETLVRDPRVRAAFEALRMADETHLRPSPGVRRIPRPMVLDNEVVLRDHLACTAVPKGIRYFGSVDLPGLLELAAGGLNDVPGLYEAYQSGSTGGAVPLPEFLGALSTLVGLGMLESSGAR